MAWPSSPRKGVGVGVGGGPQCKLCTWRASNIPQALQLQRLQHYHALLLKLKNNGKKLHIKKWQHHLHIKKWQHLKVFLIMPEYFTNVDQGLIQNVRAASNIDKNDTFQGLNFPLPHPPGKIHPSAHSHRVQIECYKKICKNYKSS